MKYREYHASGTGRERESFIALSLPSVWCPRGRRRQHRSVILSVVKEARLLGLSAPSMVGCLCDLGQVP